MSCLSFATATAAAIPSLQKQSTLSLILNHEQAEDNHANNASADFKSDDSTPVCSESQLGKDRTDLQSTSSSSSSASEVNKRQKIEMAISELNMDEEVIRDLKDAFNCSSSSTIDNVSGSDAATALLGLRNDPIVKKEEQIQSRNTPLNLPKSAHVRMQPYYAAVPIPAGFIAAKKMTRPPQAIASMASQGIASSTALIGAQSARFAPFPSRQLPPQVRRVKEYTSFSIKLRQNDRFWEIVSFSPEFEERQVKIKLVKSSEQTAGGPETETVLIEASKFMLIRCSNGSTVEKVVSARSIIPLGGKAAPNSISITCLRRGYIRIRIEKQK